MTSGDIGRLLWVSKGQQSLSRFQAHSAGPKASGCHCFLLFLPLSQPQAMGLPRGSQAPSVQEPSGSGRAPPKRTGVAVADLPSGTGQAGPACGRSRTSRFIIHS